MDDVRKTQEQRLEAVAACRHPDRQRSRNRSCSKAARPMHTTRAIAHQLGAVRHLALARGALVVGVLPGATAVVDDASVAAGSGTTRNRERGAVHRHLSCTGIVLAARATIALLGHGIRAGYRWTLHLPAVYFAVQALASLTLVYPTFSASED